MAQTIDSLVTLRQLVQTEVNNNKREKWLHESFLAISYKTFEYKADFHEQISYRWKARFRPSP